MVVLVEQSKELCLPQLRLLVKSLVLVAPRLSTCLLPMYQRHRWFPVQRRRLLKLLYWVQRIRHKTQRRKRKGSPVCSSTTTTSLPIALVTLD
nr:MAG TPA: hypothetical protein [Caudoviricetes sp.]